MDESRLEFLKFERRMTSATHRDSFEEIGTDW
jgi:hypothetical protein